MLVVFIVFIGPNMYSSSAHIAANAGGVCQALTRVRRDGWVCCSLWS